jgi:hypothetical protein
MLTKRYLPQISFGRNGNSSLDVLDYTLFLPGIWLCCGLSVCLRLIGPAFIVIPTGTCLLYAVLRRTMPPRLLSAYFGFCILSGILSAFELFPTSWQLYFIREAIVRQLIPVLGFFTVAWASKAYFRRRLQHGDVFLSASTIIVLSVIVAPAVMYSQDRGYEGDYSLFAVVALCGAFLNNMLIASFYITGAVFFARDWRRYSALFLLLGIALTSHFLQFKLFTAIVVSSLIGAPGRKVTMAVLGMLAGMYAIGLNYVPEAMLKDPNDGLRLALVADTLRSAGDTYGMGVGYGKESVRWRYRFPGMHQDFTFLPDPATMTRARMLEALSVGVHNSFAEALLRMGIPGCLLLFASFFAVFPPRTLRRDVRNHAATVFAVIFLACFVNPALESPIQAVGIGFGYGYLLALRARARVLAPRRQRTGYLGLPAMLPVLSYHARPVAGSP